MSSVASRIDPQLKAALEQVARFLDKSPTLAEKKARKILERFPDEANAMRLLGTALRLQGKSAEAIETLRDTVATAPGYAQAQQELGLSLAALGRAQEATEALRKALELQPGLPVACFALGEVLEAMGDEEGSREAYRKHLMLTAENPELVRAAEFLFIGKYAKAERLCRDFLKQHPTNVSAIRMLADIGIKLGVYSEAKALLERCLELAPDFHLARSDYVRVLFKTFKYEQAMAQVKRLQNIDPNNLSYQLQHASLLVRIGEFEKAIELYEKVLEQRPGLAKAQMSYGHVLKTIGRQRESINAYRESVRLQPGLGEAYWSLANLKTYRFSEKEISGMREQLDSVEEASEDYYHLCFALGKAFELRKNHAEAFGFYALGNAARRKSVLWDADEHSKETHGLIRFFSSEFFEAHPGVGCRARDPVFIVGLPRSGSTLLEQILASHSLVEGTMELPDMISLARRLSGKKRRTDESRYPGNLAGMEPEQFSQMGEDYLERTRIHRHERPFFIDKMPNNFFHVGLIHLILPNARIIDVRRHPMACCFSGFTQLFASGQNFTYSLEEIGRYYRDYVELMDHWDRVLPGRVLRVSYEDVVEDTENQVRRLLEYCGLSFEEKCLEFHATKRNVRTASSEQVRQPIYKDAVEHWRQFSAHLDPLLDTLGPVLERHPID